MRVFITGGSGYIGRHTIPALLQHGHRVEALVRSDSAARTVSTLGATPVRGDLTDTTGLREAAVRADGVIHLARSRTEDIAAVDRDAAEALQDGVGSGPYVHTGGVWVYGDTDGVADEEAQLSPPQISAWRLENEKRVLTRSLIGGRPVIVKPGIVYGRSGGLPQMLLVDQGYTNGAVPVIGDGANRWALVHVEDLAELYVLALSAPAATEYAGVGGQNLAFKDIAEAASQAAGCPGRLRHLTPEQASERLGPLAEALLLDQQLTGDRARHKLGWAPKHNDALAEIAAG
ncbi:NAD-dependent epimerase/dehydratase family protein [Streptomyces sp. GbtcB7]|uniref:NAD-dependent epimerase/dehydratase family protein n=1 Tax=Streptomyces sp. GbtcB7 TaxID=2824752 RepID=UPI001C30B69E|nr:NAD-dependent epimerase/dehydratase family protein [Streptomyces sp. GbtcB7]